MKVVISLLGVITFFTLCAPTGNSQKSASTGRNTSQAGKMGAPTNEGRPEQRSPIYYVQAGVNNPRAVLAYAFRLLDSLRSMRGDMIMSGLPNGNLKVASEMVQPNRLHMQIGNREIISIGSTVYSRENEGPWKKGSTINIPGLPMKPEEVMQMKSGPIINRLFGSPKLVLKGQISGEETIDGYRAIIYEIIASLRGNSSVGTNAVRIWIATEDGFPRKFEIETPKTGFKAVIRYRDLNGNITINPPIP